MEDKLTLLFWLYKSKINSTGKAPAYLRITIFGNRSEISTGQYISPKQWDSKRGHVKGNSDEAETINGHLSIIKNKIKSAYNELRQKNTPITAEVLKHHYLGKGKEAIMLLQAFSSHNKELKQRLGTNVSKSTFGKYETVKMRLTGYIKKELNRADISLGELNYNFITKFELYLKNEIGVSHNTAMKYIKFVKSIIRFCMANGWLKINPFLNFKCTFQENQRGYLTGEELHKIEYKVITVKRIAVVRDIFIFCCYTGLSFCDVFKLNSNNIISKDGNKWIVINRTKTGIRSAIPLLPKAIEILDKYAPLFEPNDIYYLLPVLSNQKMNAYLKEIGDVCGIKKNLTMHLARHTFATTVTLTNGVPIETVSKMLGHSSISTTQIYSKVVDTKIRNDMEVLQKKLL